MRKKKPPDGREQLWPLRTMALGGCLIGIDRVGNLKVTQKQDKNNLKSLESIDFMRWEDSCYGKFEVVPLTVHDRLHCHRNLDQDSLFKKFILERVRDGAVLDFDYCTVPESTFVDCFKPSGFMISNIMDLVCHLWSRDWQDKVILDEFAVKELLNEQNRTARLDRKLTEEKVKGLTQIFIPIVSDGHWSLVVVCITRKKICILDSCPGMHTVVANSLIARLQTYLLTKHNIDIGHDTETLKVQPQDNNCDCGFHVLLYIQGFDKMEIFNISTEKVLRFRKKLSMSLLYHRLNRAAAGVRIDIDEDEEKEAHSSFKDTLDGGANTPEPAPKVHHVDDNQEKSQEKDEATVDQDADTKDEETEDQDADTPILKTGRRTTVRNPIYANVPKFEPHKSLSLTKNHAICEIIKKDCNDLAVLNVGGTTMTGGELLKSLEEGGSGNALSIINTFVQLLKHDDKKAGYNNDRIILPPQDQNGEEVVENIARVLAAEGIQISGKKIKQTFLICPILHQQEWFVFFVSPDISEKVIILHSTDSKKQNDHIHFSEVFGGQVHKAFVQCGIASPIPVSDTSKAQVSNTTFNAKSKYSALAAMLFLEEYNGYAVRIKLKNEITVNDYRDSIMVHLLLHEENAAKLPPQIMEIVKMRDKRSRKKA